MVEFECFKLCFIFVSVSGEGVTVVCVSRVSASAAWDAQEDPYVSQHQQQSDKQAWTVSMITNFVGEQRSNNYFL